ncbi:MAG: AcrR family transcriptional regulator [Enterobacterales bacterium]
MGNKLNRPDVKVLKPRREPRQGRSIKRAQEIMDVTARLLDRVGFDDLTTILITKEMGISVGSLYHYFPNKHAILHSLAESWLNDWDIVLSEISKITVEEMDLKTIVEKFSTALLGVYKQQRGVLPLVQAMYAVPELRDLDERHDKIVVKFMSAIFIRMGINQSKSELARISSVFIEVTHALLVMVLAQKGQSAERTLNDLNSFIYNLLNRYKS